MKQSTLPTLENANILDIEHLNLKLKKATPRNILSWLVSNYPNGLVQVSNFSIDDLVITDILYSRLQPNKRIPVIFIDTLHHFRETWDLVEKVKNFYNLDLKIYQVAKANSRQDFADKYGEALWQKDPAKFAYLTKIEPLQRALNQLNAKSWINSLYEGDCESNPEVLNLDTQGRLEIRALSNWNRTESWAYAYEYDLMYNPLYDEGYSVIDNHLSSP